MLPAGLRRLHKPGARSSSTDYGMWQTHVQLLSGLQAFSWQIHDTEDFVAFAGRELMTNCLALLTFKSVV